MRKIRVLIVDDAVVVRRMVSDVLSADPAIEVAGTAANGSIGLAKIAQVAPDLVTLDVEMPGMDGIAALKEIRKLYPRLPVIMFSTLTQRCAATTLDALALGANDYVTKPANVGSVAVAMQRIRDELIPKIKGFCAAAAGLDSPVPVAKALVATPKLSSQDVARGARRVDVVAIGVSTGGPNALAYLLPRLPADFPVPILIVQHMPPLFTKLLADRLSAQAAIGVSEAAEGDEILPKHAWLAPGDHHMQVEAARVGASVRVKIQQEAPENSCRPAVDPLFRSVADTYGSHVLAVVLTGMGQDGLRGCQTIVAAHGQVIVQDEASSVVWGMPGYVAEAGLAERVLPLDLLPAEITRRVRVGRPAAAPMRATGA
jgi:two-component system chemotaxis response regulator CheB